MLPVFALSVLFFDKIEAIGLVLKWIGVTNEKNLLICKIMG
jgi:hypothetical protein